MGVSRNQKGDEEKQAACQENAKDNIAKPFKRLRHAFHVDRFRRCSDNVSVVVDNAVEGLIFPLRRIIGWSFFILQMKTPPCGSFYHKTGSDMVAPRWRLSNEPKKAYS